MSDETVASTPVETTTPAEAEAEGSGTGRYPEGADWTTTGDGTDYPKGTSAEPTFSPVPGIFNAPVAVTLAASGPEVVISYTTDGTVPTTSSPSYAGPFVLGTTTTVKAIATAPDQLSSPVVEAQYAVSVIQSAPAPSADTTTSQKIGNEVAAGVQRAEVMANGALDATGAFAQTVETEVVNAKAALAHLETSSNATATGTIVQVAISRFAGVIATLEAALGIHRANTTK